MAELRPLVAQYFLNHRLEAGELQRQMREVAAAGYQGVYPHARQGLLTPYMSDDWWRAIDVILDMCRRQGLEFWIWDEDYFPSGLAGGRVVWGEPGYAARQLEFHIANVSGAGPFEVDFDPGMLLRAFAVPGRDDSGYADPIDVTAFCGTRRQRWTERRLKHSAYSPLIDPIGHPHWRSSMEDNRFALSWTPPEAGDYTVVAALVQHGRGDHPDILRPEVVRRFIDLSYEPYRRRYGREFGKTIKGAFTDEPSPGGGLFPWTARFPEEFALDHGYDLLPHLAHLALDIDERSATLRHHYRLTQHRLQVESYTGQIASWCEKHRIRAVGHLTRTEWLSLVAAWWPNELRAYRPMHIPCADPLGASTGWPDAAAYHTGLKVASSAAHLFGRDQAGSDALAVIGDEANLRDMKHQLDYQMALGINHFSIHGLSYSIDGPRKDEVPPSLFYQHSEWKHMPVLLEHVRRTCEALTGGEHVCELAVLYPSTSLGCQLRPGNEWPNLPDEALIHGLVERLLSYQRDFDFIDEATLQESVGPRGAVRTREPYRVILLPHLRYIDQATAAALLRFARAGGRVIAVGAMPLALGTSLEEPRAEWADESVPLLPGLDEATLRELPGPDVRGHGARGLLVLRRRKGGKLYTFVVNRREEPFSGRVDGAAVNVPPRGSVLLTGAPDDNPGPRRRSVALVPKEVERWGDDWTVEFEPNQLPLGFWHVARGEDQGQANPASGPGFDLMGRGPDPAGEGDGAVTYYCRFMLSGDIPDALLVLEPSAVTGEWRLLVNGRPVREWRQALLYDYHNLVAEASQGLRRGPAPTLNVITVETRGPGRGLREVPYLYGSFTCEYRYGHLSLPFLRGVGEPMTLASLDPWSAIGYPTFSGSAVYRRTITVPAVAGLTLDLGRVEDVAVVRVDGQELAALGWPPYQCSLAGVLPGTHELTIEVTNAPANRNRAAGLPSGLLGPVRLLRGG